MKVNGNLKLISQETVKLSQHAESTTLLSNKWTLTKMAGTAFKLLLKNLVVDVTSKIKIITNTVKPLLKATRYFIQEIQNTINYSLRNKLNQCTLTKMKELEIECLSKTKVPIIVSLFMTKNLEKVMFGIIDLLTFKKFQFKEFC